MMLKEGNMSCEGEELMMLGKEYMMMRREHVMLKRRFSDTWEVGMEYMLLRREHVMLRRETSDAWDGIYNAKDGNMMLRKETCHAKERN